MATEMTTWWATDGTLNMTIRIAKREWMAWPRNRMETVVKGLALVEAGIRGGGWEGADGETEPTTESHREMR